MIHASDVIFAKTGGFSGSGTVQNKDTTNEKTYKVSYRLTSKTGDFIDLGEAWNYAWNKVDKSFNDGTLVSVDVDLAEDSYGQMYDVTANYEKSSDEDDEKAEDESQEDPTQRKFATMSWSTKGGREKRIHSMATVKYPGVGTPPDFQGGIGYSNGTFQGCDIVVPRFGFSLNLDMKAAYYTDAQHAFLQGLTGCVNASSFKGWASGCCLCLGMSGDTYWEQHKGVYEKYVRLSFEFEGSPPFQGSLPPFGVVTKQGYQYIWCFHADQKDETSKITVPKPIALYVETVYPSADFGWLNNVG